MIERGSGCEEQGIGAGGRNDHVLVALQPVAGEAELAALVIRSVRLAVEPHLAAPGRIGVQPLGFHPVVGQLESVGVTDRPLTEEEVHFEEAGLSLRFRGELERLSWYSGPLAPVGEGLQHCPPHEPQGVQDVALAGGVGSEDADRRQHGHRLALGPRAGLPGGALIELRGHEGKFGLLPDGPVVGHPKTEQHGRPPDEAGTCFAALGSYARVIRTAEPKAPPQNAPAFVSQR